MYLASLLSSLTDTVPSVRVKILASLPWSSVWVTATVLSAGAALTVSSTVPPPRSSALSEEMVMAGTALAIFTVTLPVTSLWLALAAL